jgi:hypothetical protein
MLHIKEDLGLAVLQFTNTKYEEKLTVHTYSIYITQVTVYGAVQA